MHYMRLQYLRKITELREEMKALKLESNGGECTEEKVPEKESNSDIALDPFLDPERAADVVKTTKESLELREV